MTGQKQLLITIYFLLSFTFSQSQSQPPNIIVILADDQGWGATSVQMDQNNSASASDFVRTPNLQQLADKSMVFSNGYASHPNCSPSRASLLTGKSPAQLGLTDIVERSTGPLYEGNYLTPAEHIDRLASEETTIAEWIKRHHPDYTTAHFGKWHLANSGPENNGFDAGDGATTNDEGSQNIPGDPKQVFGITRRGIDWMEKQVSDKKPFYLQLSHYATHLPMEARPSTMDQVGKWPAGKRHNHQKFAAMSYELDTAIGILLKKVEDLGIADHTYIIYTSDNGTYPTTNPGNINGPLHGWKATVWEGAIRVPFMVSGPGIQPGRSDERVVGYDIFPTICEWLGIDELPEGVEGGSMAGLLSQERKKVHRPHDFLVFHFPHYQLQKASHPATALYQDRHKLIEFYETGNLHLFDLDNDRLELVNLVVKEPLLTSQLKDSLHRYLDEVGAKMPVKNNDYDENTDPGRNLKERKLKLMNKDYFIIKD